ncbi:MAG: hypothetical protein KJ921_15730, partial [Proteobacteria bacterium]|nr:hypothetical protein [Pseudomonadota bacterium]
SRCGAVDFDTRPIPQWDLRDKELGPKRWWRQHDSETGEIHPFITCFVVVMMLFCCGGCFFLSVLGDLFGGCGHW